MLHERERLIIKATSTPVEFESATLFLRKQGLRERSSWRHDTHMISLTEFSFNTNQKKMIVKLLNSSGAVRTENI